MRLGKRVKLYRKKMKLSAAELALIVGVTKSNIYQIERGVHDPSMDLFVKLLNALNVTPEDLLQDRMHAAAVDVFERTHFDVVSALSAEATKRCNVALYAIAAAWEKDL